MSGEMNDEKNEFFEIIPLDTLFFRGSTPMESGMMNVISVFPPPVSVIKGAFWTARTLYLHQMSEKKLDKPDFTDGLKNGNIPYDVKGIFIKKTDAGGTCSKYYAPAPATWYYDSDKTFFTGKSLKGLELVEAKSLSEKTLGLKCSSGDVVFVKAEKDAKSLLNAWISLDFLKSSKTKFGEDDVLFNSDILSYENRTNVALDNNRKAKQGQLFSSTHIRLNEGFSLVVCFSDSEGLLDSAGLPDEGKFLFGGEKRLSKFKRIKDKLPELNFMVAGEGLPTKYYSLVPQEATDEAIKAIVSSGKLFVTAGWDFAKRFHKPTTSWIPAGAVFNENINNLCVALPKVPAKKEK